MILALTIFLLEKASKPTDKEPSLLLGIVALTCLFVSLMTDIAIIQLLNRL